MSCEPQVQKPTYRLGRYWITRMRRSNREVQGKLGNNSGHRSPNITDEADCVLRVF